MRPAQSLVAGLPGATCSSSMSAGRTMSGSINSTYESKANPIAAMIAISHCDIVRRGSVASDWTVVMKSPPWALYYVFMPATPTRSSLVDVSAQTARDRLDAWVRGVVDWHFDPAPGCPFWPEFAANAGRAPRPDGAASARPAAC